MLQYEILCNECGIEFCGNNEMLCSCPDCNSFDCEIIEMLDDEDKETDDD